MTTCRHRGEFVSGRNTDLKGTMGRGSKAILAFVVAGGLAASSVTSRGAFVAGFFFLFFGLIVGLVAWVAGGRGSSKSNSPHEDFHRDELGVRSPLLNEIGVHRYIGDALDLENHPEPGACGRVDRNWRETVISPFADRP